MSIATSVRSHLDKLGVPFDVISHPHTSDSSHTAQAAHVPGERLAKAVMLEDERGYLMAVLPASRKLDLGALHRALGRDRGLATENELAVLFADCEAGALPPMGEAYGIDVIVDDRLEDAADVYFEAGDHTGLVHVSGPDFQRLMGDAPRERIRNVNVFRLPMKRLRGSKFAYLWQYTRFLLSSFWFLLKNSIGKKYDVVHVHNMPDFLVFAALIPKLRGARILLDLHDPMPELMMSIYGLAADRWPVRILRMLERASIKFSHLVLTPNIAFKDLFVSRGCPPDKMQIVMNSPQIEIFDPARVPEHPPARDSRRFRVMHHGLIAHRHGVDQLVEAVAKLRSTIPGIQLDIYGSRTAFLDVVLETAQKTGCSDIVHYHGTKSQAEIAQAILDCDVGVVPNRRSMFTELNFPTRLFEYLAMRRLVIAPSTKGIRDYFTDRQIVYFEPGDVADLTARIRWVWEHPAESREIVSQGLKVYEHHLWPEERKHFHKLVSQLLSKP